MICYHLTCGFRAQAENEHYRISVVATNTKGILEYWIICGDRGCASLRRGSQCGSTETSLMCWWQHGRSHPGSESSTGTIVSSCQHIFLQVSFLLGFDCYTKEFFFFFFTLEKNDDGMPAWQASGCLFKARVLVSFSTSHSYITLECNVPSDTAPNYTFLPRLLRSFFWPCCKSKEGKKKKKRKKRKKNGPPSRTAFYTRLISMLGCLNCLLEGWREIEQYPLALETSPIASHLFLCRVRTDLGTTPLRKLSPGRPGLGRSGQIN